MLKYALFAGVAVSVLLFSALLLKILIPKLREMKIGQMILEEGPVWHKSKEGTPTMGGLAFIVAVPLFTGIFIALIWAMGNGTGVHGEPISAISLNRVWLTLAYAVACGICGIIDDLCKLLHRANGGLRAWQKYLILLAFTAAYLWAMHRFCDMGTEVYIPFFGVRLDFGVFYWVFAAVLLTGTVNAVNLTDGIDGLCGSVSAVAVLFYFACALWVGNTGLGVLAACGFGSICGFLSFNLYPAGVFMGDTGSLFIGGLISALAFASELPMTIFVVGIIYMLEALSVIIQVLVYKLSGKRIFKMAPIHHHLEKSNWSERKIVRLFTACTALAALACALLG